MEMFALYLICKKKDTETDDSLDDYDDDEEEKEEEEEESLEIQLEQLEDWSGDLDRKMDR
jgi:hypothetical protein